MRGRLIPLIGAATAVALSACGDSVTPTAPDRGESLALGRVADAGDSYIVVFNRDVTDAPGLARRLVGAHGGTLRFTYEHAIKGFAAQLPAAAVQALERNPNVAYVEPDGIVTTMATQTNATWGLDRIDQRNLPLNGTYTYDFTGSGVNVYIIDTGIRLTHNEFGGRAFTGFDAVTAGGTANDCNGHGTHVAGTVGGSIYGVAKSVRLYAVRVLNCAGSGTWAGVIAGVDYVTGNHVKPAVANMSLGGGANSALDQAVNNSVAAGVTYAVAAGNSNANACNYSPARAANAITVGATVSSDARASYSNYGSCVNIFAPGSSITSAWHSSNTSINTISGTSMASPHVAGVAALYLQGSPSASPAAVASAIMEASTKNKVTNSNSTNNHLLYSLFGTTPPPTNQPPVANFTVSCSGLTCNFTDTSTDDGSIVSRSWAFGDGATSTATNPSHTYSTGDTYTVSLTVTDNGGLTGNTSKNVTVSAPAPPGDPSVSLTVSGSTNKGGVHSAALSWTGGGPSYDIYRNGAAIRTGYSGSSYSENLGKSSATYSYVVCNAGTSACSNESSVTFPLP